MTGDWELEVYCIHCCDTGLADDDDLCGHCEQNPTGPALERYLKKVEPQPQGDGE